LHRGVAVGGGSHTFAVTASNGAGSSSPATFTWTVDTTQFTGFLGDGVPHQALFEFARPSK
jgi:hypothetical protein